MLPRETRATGRLPADAVRRAFLRWRRLVTSVLRRRPKPPQPDHPECSTDRAERASVRMPVFSSWRRELTRALRSVRSRARSVRARAAITAKAVYRLLAHAEMPAGTALGGVIAIACTLAIAGAGLAAVVAPAGQLDRALASGGLMLVWLSARLAVMWTVWRPRGPRERALLTASWAAGTIPFVIAIVPVTRVLAWCLGVAAAYRVLRHSNPDVRRAGYTVAAGFAVEAVGLAAVIASRNASVLLRVLSNG